MRRRFFILSLAALTAAMLALSVPSASADPVGHGTGCVYGQLNAYTTLGTGNASGERRAPYLENPGEGTGPSGGFATAEANTRDTSNCQNAGSF